MEKYSSQNGDSKAKLSAKALDQMIPFVPLYLLSITLNHSITQSFNQSNKLFCHQETTKKYSVNI